MPTIQGAPRRFDFLGTRTQLQLLDQPPVLFTADRDIQEIIATAILAERCLRVSYEDTPDGAWITQITLGEVGWNGITRAAAADYKVVALEPGPFGSDPAKAILSREGAETTVTADANSYEILRIAFRLGVALQDPAFNDTGLELTHAVVEVSDPPPPLAD